ncbi:GNAT family N-acetyltransferase [Flavobacterium luteum]|uniref:GNAT family N-acetyltransferase n=1 Tax=Flavobacterium luteum TaxID=2026654 RepID=A0A7J5AJP1_9FLAO|nr:GNAT family N-acetyltransferase [Flavobacterium luteum]KAB1157796.1 GNAT family N-acetyltransferase [Flavobacterium luteum]
MKIIETERLIIKPTSIEDAQFIFELLNTKKWIEFIGDRGVYSIKDAEEYIANKLLPQIERLGFGNFTIIRKSDNKKIGSCGLYNRDGIDGIDIGFALLPNYEKFGYAFESVNKLKEVAFNDFKLKEIKGITLVKNIASQNLLKKIGLEFEDYIKVSHRKEKIMLFKIYKKED